MGIDISGLLGSIERAGGYAALLVLFGVALFVLANKQMTQQADRSAAREAESIRRNEEALAQERANAQEHRADKLMLVSVVESNAKATQELSGVMKGALSEQREARREITETRKEIAELRRDLATRSLPKRSSARKPEVSNE